MWRRFGNVGVEGDELGLATASSSSSQLQARQLLRLAAVVRVLALAAVVVVVRGSAPPAPLLPLVLSSFPLLFLGQRRRRMGKRARRLGPEGLDREGFITRVLGLRPPWDGADGR
jgi:hypothetical protein